MSGLDWFLPTPGGRGRRCRHRGKAAEEACHSATRPQRCISAATTSSPISRASSRRARARSSSTSTMTAPWSALRYEVENRVRGAAGARYHARVGGAIHAVACPETLRSARRSLRAGRHHLEPYYDWLISQPYVIMASPGDRRESSWRRFKEYPPSQRPDSFSVDVIVDKMQRGLSTPYKVIGALAMRRLLSR